MCLCPAHGLCCGPHSNVPPSLTPTSTYRSMYMSLRSSILAFRFLHCINQPLSDCSTARPPYMLLSMNHAPTTPHSLSRRLLLALISFQSNCKLIVLLMLLSPSTSLHPCLPHFHTTGSSQYLHSMTHYAAVPCFSEAHCPLHTTAIIGYIF